MPLCGRIYYQLYRQPKLSYILYSSNRLFGGAAADAGNDTPTFCFGVPAISKLTTLSMESQWTFADRSREKPHLGVWWGALTTSTIQRHIYVYRMMEWQTLQGNLVFFIFGPSDICLSKLLSETLSTRKSNNIKLRSIGDIERLQSISQKMMFHVKTLTVRDPYPIDWQITFCLSRCNTSCFSQIRKPSISYSQMHTRKHASLHWIHYYIQM